MKILNSIALLSNTYVVTYFTMNISFKTNIRNGERIKKVLFCELLKTCSVLLFVSLNK